MISDRTDDLFEELKESVKYRDENLEGYRELREQVLAGNRAMQNARTDQPRNHPYEFISTAGPRILDQTPRVSVSTARYDSEGATLGAQAIHHGLNRLAREQDMRKRGMPCVVDMLMRWGVGRVTMTAQPTVTASLRADERALLDPYLQQGPEQAPTIEWPTFGHVPIERFVLDAACAVPWEARFRAQLYVEDPKKLSERARKAPESQGWNLRAIQRLEGHRSPEETGLDYMGGTERRKVATYWEVWVPEHDPEDLLRNGEDPAGFHGTIYTIADDGGKPLEIRKPRGFFGPEWGPWQLFGAWWVSGCPWPVGPLAATRPQQDASNRVAAAVLRAIEAYKRGFLIRGSRAVSRRLQMMRHDTFMALPEIDKQFLVPYEVGGVPDALLRAAGYVDENTNLALGLSDAMRGQPDPGQTATADTIAAQYGGTKIGQLRDQARAGFTEAYKTKAWYLLNSDRVVIRLGREEQEALGMTNPFFIGGPGGEREGSGVGMADLELQIEPYSMAPMNEAAYQRNVLLGMQTLGQMVPLGEAMDLQLAARLLSNALNIPELQGLIRPQAGGGVMQTGSLAIPGSINITAGSPQQGGTRAVQPSGPASGAGTPGAVQARQNQSAGAM